MDRKRRTLKRLVSALGLVLIASLLLSAFAAGSASATTQQWYSCNNVGGSGIYTDSTCQTAGSGSYDWSKLPSAPTNFAIEETGVATLSSTLAGVSVNVECKTGSATGSLANPTGAAGSLTTETGSSLALSGCEAFPVTKPTKKCAVKGGGIPFAALSGEAIEQENGAHAVNLQPAEGSTIASFTIEAAGSNCFTKTPIAATVTGSFTGVLNPATSSLEFTEAGSKNLKANGAAAQLKATAPIETAAKERLRLGVAPPINLTVPSVSPANPNVGSAVTASNGTWAHEPSSYTYQWKRCSSTGTECGSIAGAAKSTYTPNQYDEAHTLVVQVTAINAGGSTPASSAPTGVVNAELTGAHHWYVCREVGFKEGAYGDESCLNGGEPGNFEWVQLKAGSPSSITATNLTPIKVSVEVAKVKTVIECAGESGSGTVENPAGGGGGKLTGNASLLTLTACKVTAPAECTIPSEQVTGYSVLASTTAGKIAVTPTGSNLFSFSLNASKCIISGATVSGTLNGTVNSAYSSLVFDSTSGTELKGAGATYWFEGAIQVKSEGALLRFKP
jgi:hypothetical protein